MNISNSNCEYLTVHDQFDLQVRREGSVVYVSALRSDGSLGASMAFNESRLADLVDALNAVRRRR